MFMKERFSQELPGASLAYVGRDEAASPATGSHQVHTREQEEILQEALGSKGLASRAAAQTLQPAARSRNGGDKAPAKENGGRRPSGKERNLAK